MDKWKNIEIEDWGGTVSPQFKEFAKDFKAHIQKLLKPTGFKITKYSVNHYEVSEFAENEETGKIIYFSVSDVRYFSKSWLNDILVRTATSTFDYTGGVNNFTTLEGFAGKVNAITRF